MSPRKLRTAIVGTGGIAKIHIEALQANEDIYELCAVCDVDIERAKAFIEGSGVKRCYQSLQELLQHEELDLVQISTPPATHVTLAIQAMEAGIDVLCEKPLCGSLADYHKLREAEERTGKWCASVFQFRYGAGTEHLRRLIQDGTLGRPLLAICHTLWMRDRAYYELEWRGIWSTELGGPTTGHGIHAMDHLLSIMGDWSEVRADMGTLDRPIEVEDASLAIIRFQNGAMGSIVNSILCANEVTYHRLDFQKATVELRHLYAYENADWSFTAAPDLDDEFTKKLESIPQDNRSDHAAQLKAIAEDIRSGRTPETSGVQAEATIDLISSLYKAALTGKPVARGSIKPGDPFYDSFHGGHDVQHRMVKSQKKATV